MSTAHQQPGAAGCWRHCPARPLGSRRARGHRPLPTAQRQLHSAGACCRPAVDHPGGPEHHLQDNVPLRMQSSLSLQHDKDALVSMHNVDMVHRRRAFVLGRRSMSQRMRRCTMSTRPERAAMCSGVSRLLASVTARPSARCSTSVQMASTLAGPCGPAVLHAVRCWHDPQECKAACLRHRPVQKTTSEPAQLQCMLVARPLHPDAIIRHMAPDSMCCGPAMLHAVRCWHDPQECKAACLRHRPVQKTTSEPAQLQSMLVARPLHPDAIIRHMAPDSMCTFMTASTRGLKPLTVRASMSAPSARS